MKKLLSANLIGLAEDCPYPVYVVGGFVRDFLAHETARDATPDIDICAPAAAEDFAERALSHGFRVDATYKHTGTLKLTKEGQSYEFSSFRSDRYVRGEHRPEKAYFTEDICLDARRRDFCCNAVYYGIVGGQFVDPLGGIADISRKILSTVAPAEKVFGEDGLRLMRLARIAAQTGFSPTEECLAGARSNAGLIADISAERIFAELMQILRADEKYGIVGGQLRGVGLLEEIGVLQIILPEVDLRRGGGAVKNALSRAEGEGRLYALFSNCSPEIARRALERLKAPKKAIKTCGRLLSATLPEGEGEAREFAVENSDILPELSAFWRAQTSPDGERLAAVVGEMRAARAPLSLKDLAVRGNDLIACGTPPAEVGKSLNLLLKAAARGDVRNEKQSLINYLK